MISIIIKIKLIKKLRDVSEGDRKYQSKCLYNYL